MLIGEEQPVWVVSGRDLGTAALHRCLVLPNMKLPARKTVSVLVSPVAFHPRGEGLGPSEVILELQTVASPNS
jgi:hypothetical protein